MLSLERSSFQRSLADFAARLTCTLADASVCVSVVQAAGNATSVTSAAHQDHTPSPLGQRVVPTALLPNFSGGRVGLKTGHQRTKVAANSGWGETHRVGQASKSSEGSGTCLFGKSFLVAPPALALRPAAITLANKPWAVASLARVLRRSPVVAFCKARPSVRPATSPIASLTPANVAGTDPLKTSHRLNFRHLNLAYRAAPADAVLRVSLKTQKDTSCSRKS